jgi:hypothetical protein
MDRQTLARLDHPRTERTERILRHYAAQRRVTSPSLILAMALRDLQGRNGEEEGK